MRAIESAELRKVNGHEGGRGKRGEKKIIVSRNARSRREGFLPMKCSSNDGKNGM